MLKILDKIGTMLFCFGIVGFLIHLKLSHDLTKFDILFFSMSSVGSALTIPQEYKDLREDLDNSLQTRKSFIGSILGTIWFLGIVILSIIYL